MEALELGITQGITDIGSRRDPWSVLETFAARDDIDPSLRGAITEALAAHRSLLGVTVAVTLSQLDRCDSGRNHDPRPGGSDP
jgi:hypothetical protein